MPFDVYALCLIVGGGVLLLSLVGGELTEMLDAVAMRALTFAVAGFGAAGLLARFAAPETNPFGVALLTGIALFFGTKALFKMAAGRELDASPSENAVGRLAEVTVPIRAGGLGMVRLELNGQLQTLRAQASESVTAGATVLIIAQDERGTLEVSPSEEGGWAEYL